MSGPGSRFVDVPAARLMAELDEMGAGVTKRGGRYVVGQIGREVVVDFVLPASRVSVRVFTSLAAGAGSVRDCGEDAVRIALVSLPADDGGRARPMSEGSDRVFRTAPKGEPAARVEAFIARFKQRVRDAYKAALAVPVCPRCGAGMRKRDGRNGPFMGCASYPSCRGTRPIQLAPRERASSDVSRDEAEIAEIEGGQE